MRYHLAVLALILAVSIPAAAQEQPQQQLPCGDRTKIIAHIAKKFKEAPRAMAITGGNSFMEIFVSPAGTWTTLITEPAGRTCIVATGEGWEDIAIKPVGTSL